jgi:hypothetical protein
MQVCPELEMAVLSLARFMPVDYQREAARRIIEVYEEWLQAGNGAKLLSASSKEPSPARKLLVTDAVFTEVVRE